MVRVGNNTSASLNLNMGAPQGWLLCPLLDSLFTHDGPARRKSNAIFKFSEDTAVVCLIKDNNEIAYREALRDLAVWCQDNNLSLNVIKPKRVIVDYRKQWLEHTPFLIDRAVGEQGESVKSLGVHITNKLSWSKTVVKLARQNLFPLRRLKIFGMGPQILNMFYSCTIERHCLV